MKPDTPLTPGQSEEGDQILFVNWVNRTYPDQAGQLHHSPNGGYRDRRTGHRMKLMGTKAGFPDLVLYHPVRPYAGLVVELKTDKGVVSDRQTEWLKSLRACGFRTAVCRGLDEAQATLREYMGEPE